MPAGPGTTTGRRLFRPPVQPLAGCNRARKALLAAMGGSKKNGVQIHCGHVYAGACVGRSRHGRGLPPPPSHDSLLHKHAVREFPEDILVRRENEVLRPKYLGTQRAEASPLCIDLEIKQRYYIRDGPE